MTTPKPATDAPQSGELTPSEPVRLEKLLQVVPKAVVSRTILKRDKGNVTIFAFDKGEGLSEHTAPFDALVTILQGNANLTIGGDPIALEAGQSIIMPANVPHAVLALTPMQMLLVMIRE